MKQPIVTILIPTYNRAHFLREALKSAVNQTYKDLEILILDDASPDNTSLVAAEFCSDPRVRYIQHKKNIGITENWRTGIQTAAGDFFCLLHDDDTFEATFVEKLLAPMLEDPTLIISFCDHWIMNEGGERSKALSDQASQRFKRSDLPEGRLSDWAGLTLIDSTIPVGATLFRKSMILPEFIDVRAKGAIDAWLFYRCAKTGGAAYYCAQRLMNYRQHSSNMSQGAGLYMSDGHIFRNRQILNDPEMIDLHAKISKLLSISLAHQGVYLLLDNQQNAAKTALRQSLDLHKTKKSIAAYGLACCGPLGSALARVAHSRRLSGTQ